MLEAGKSALPFHTLCCPSKRGLDVVIPRVNCYWVIMRLHVAFPMRFLGLSKQDGRHMRMICAAVSGTEAVDLA